MVSSAVSQPLGGRAVGYVVTRDPAPIGDDTTGTAAEGARAAKDSGGVVDWGDEAGWTADEAVTRLFATQYRPLVRLATLLLHDAGLAEEITQDAFVGLHERWGRLRDPQRAVAYLRQSVVNRARSALRHRGVVDRFLRRQSEPATASSAESAVIDAHDHAAVLAAVRLLPARQREALALRYYLDLTEAQTAEAMGVSEGAVKSHTFRALTALRRHLRGAP
jgi:RNA polymerase sigma-70 factor (sigma-E family)